MKEKEKEEEEEKKKVFLSLLLASLIRLYLRYENAIE